MHFGRQVFREGKSVNRRAGSLQSEQFLLDFDGEIAVGQEIDHVRPHLQGHSQRLCRLGVAVSTDGLHPIEIPFLKIGDRRLKGTSRHGNRQVVEKDDKELHIPLHAADGFHKFQFQPAKSRLGFARMGMVHAAGTVDEIDESLPWSLDSEKRTALPVSIAVAGSRHRRGSVTRRGSSYVDPVGHIDLRWAESQPGGCDGANPRQGWRGGRPVRPVG